MTWVLRILGTPAPQGSKRHVGHGVLVESSKAVAPWREAIVAQAQRDDLAGIRLDGPLRLTVTFWLTRPTTHTGANGLRPSAPLWPHRKPDIDKLLRSTLDGLVQAAVIADDARIVTVDMSKVYADQGNPPGALIRITEAEGDRD